MSLDPLWNYLTYAHTEQGSAECKSNKKEKLLRFVRAGARFFSKDGHEWLFYGECEEGVFFKLADGKVEQRLVSDDNPWSSRHGTQQWVSVDNTRPTFFAWGQLGKDIFAVPSPIEDLDIPYSVSVPKKAPTPRARKNPTKKKVKG